MTERRKKKDRFWEFVKQPKAMELIYNRLVSGGTLVHVCREFDIHYPFVLRWINADDGRKARFDEAVRDREHHVKEAVLRELLDLLTIDRSEAYSDDGTLKNLKDIPENLRRFIHTVDVEESKVDIDGRSTITTAVKKIKFHDKMQAVPLLMKHLKMLTERHEHTVSESLADLLARSGPPEKTL